MLQAEVNASGAQLLETVRQLQGANEHLQQQLHKQLELNDAAPDLLLPVSSPGDHLALEVMPFLRNSGPSSSAVASSSMRVSSAHFRRDAGIGGGLHDFNAASLAASEDSNPDNFTWRPISTVPIFRQLPPRLQSACSDVDQSCTVLTRYFLEVPGARMGVIAWLVFVHVWWLFLVGASPGSVYMPYHY